VSRATYMQLADLALLNDWADHLRQMFPPPAFTPMLVGSALTRADYRDVDVRVILPYDAWERLADVMDVRRLNVTLSLWGRTATGLPIDCQVQSQYEADNERKNPRRPLGNPRSDP
jgi:hypothetical protein